MDKERAIELQQKALEDLWELAHFLHHEEIKKHILLMYGGQFVYMSYDISL